MDQRGPEGTRGDQRRPEGTRGDQRGPEGTRGDQRGQEGTRGDQRGPEGTRGDQRGPEGTRGDQRGPEGTRGDQRGPAGNRGDQRGPEGTRGDQRGPEGTRGDQRGPEGTRGDQRGPEWTRGDHSGPEGTRVDQRGPEGTRGDQRGPEGTRGDQRGPEGTTGDHGGPGGPGGDKSGPDGTRGNQRGPEGTRWDQRGPEGTRGISLLIRTRADHRDQRGPEGPATVMAEINVRTLMFNLGPEDAIDSTTSAKIACYTERKQLAYKLTDEGILLLDGRGKKIHLKNGVVTLRNALGLHALPERIMTNVMREDVSLQGQRCCAIDSIGDNHVLTKQQHTHIVTTPTTQTNMLNVRKMALVDPRLLKSLHENTTPQPPVDKILHDLDAEMTSILGSDTDVSEKVRLYNQVLLRYNEMTNTRAAKPTPVVVMKSDTVDYVPTAGATVETTVVTAG